MTTEQALLTKETIRRIVASIDPTYHLRFGKRPRYSASRQATETTYVQAYKPAQSQALRHLGTLAKLSQMSEVDLTALIRSKFDGETMP